MKKKTAILIEDGFLRRILDRVSAEICHLPSKQAKGKWFREETIRAFYRKEQTQFRDLIRNKAGFEWTHKRPYSFGEIILVQGYWRQTEQGIRYRALEKVNASYNRPTELNHIQAGCIVLFVLSCIKQNIHNMTYHDALASGIQKTENKKGWHVEGGKFFDEHSPINAFANYWDAINRKNGLSWNGNPKVWATTCIPIVV